MDIRIYTGDRGAKTEQKFKLRLINRCLTVENCAKRPDRTGPAFGLRVGKNQKHNSRYADANR